MIRILKQTKIYLNGEIYRNVITFYQNYINPVKRFYIMSLSKNTKIVPLKNYFLDVFSSKMQRMFKCKYFLKAMISNFKKHIF